MRVASYGPGLVKRQCLAHGKHSPGSSPPPSSVQSTLDMMLPQHSRAPTATPPPTCGEAMAVEPMGRLCRGVSSSPPDPSCSRGKPGAPWDPPPPPSPASRPPPSTPAPAPTGPRLLPAPVDPAALLPPYPGSPCCWGSSGPNSGTAPAMLPLDGRPDTDPAAESGAPPSPAPPTPPYPIRCASPSPAKPTRGLVPAPGTQSPSATSRQPVRRLSSSSATASTTPCPSLLLGAHCCVLTPGAGAGAARRARSTLVSLAGLSENGPLAASHSK